MAGRLRSPGATVVLILGLALPAAGVEEGWTCWSTTAPDGNGQTVTVTRCRLGGSERIEDYGSTAEIPVRLSPNVGAVGVELCWYWTTRSSDWVLLGMDDDLAATLGIDPDGIPGGPVITSATYPVCTAEPTEEPNPLDEAYELVESYSHPAPDPLLDPPIGSGLAGLATYITLDTPVPWSATLVSPITGLTIEVESRIAAVEIDWGDGHTTVVPASAIQLLRGWPDGAFGHVYESATENGHRLEISFLWNARYRVDGGTWEPIDVDDTTWSATYDIDEVRGLTTGVG